MIFFCNTDYRCWSNCDTRSKRKTNRNELIRQVQGEYAWSSNGVSPSGSSALQHLRRFKYRQLKSATESFSDKRILGRGAFGIVYRGVLSNGEEIAVKKLIDQQGEGEFDNELAIAGCLDSPYVVKLLGYCTRGKRVRLLVYERMENGSLQEALFNKRDSTQQTASTSSSLIGWSQRFKIIKEIAQALELLHLHNPPIIHGDIKPSNVLLDKSLSARIADFGLARFKTADLATSASISPDMNSPSSHQIPDMTNPSINTDVSPGADHNRSGPYNEKYSPSSFENKYRKPLVAENYVLDWLGKGLDSANVVSLKKAMALDKDPASGDKIQLKHSSDSRKTKPEPRKRREWWRDEYFDELESKSKARQNIQWGNKFSENKYFNDSMDFFSGELRKPDNKSILDGCRSQSHEWMRSGYKSRMRVSSMSNETQMWSGELKTSTGELIHKHHHNRQWSGDLSVASTTTSMRGTVCYVAPESGGLNNAFPSEKCDIYSFGVLMLVIISGRRPIQISGSRPQHFERANLISWARKLAQTGDLLDLMDERLGGEYNNQQANLSINLAMQCLQRVPDNRPDISKVLRVLQGEI